MKNLIKELIPLAVAIAETQKLKIIEGEYTSTDGKTIWINLNEQVKKYSKEIKRKFLRSSVAHEAGHIRHTDFKLVQKFQKNNFRVKELAHYLFNIAEDNRIDKLVKQEFEKLEEDYKVSEILSYKMRPEIQSIKKPIEKFLEGLLQKFLLNNIKGKIDEIIESDIDHIITIFKINSDSCEECMIGSQKALDYILKKYDTGEDYKLPELPANWGLHPGMKVETKKNPFWAKLKGKIVPDDSDDIVDLSITEEEWENYLEENDSFSEDKIPPQINIMKGQNSSGEKNREIKIGGNSVNGGGSGFTNNLTAAYNNPGEIYEIGKNEAKKLIKKFNELHGPEYDEDLAIDGYDLDMDEVIDWVADGREEERPLFIDEIELDAPPITHSIVLVIDVSGSMYNNQPYIGGIITLTGYFAKELEIEYGIVAYADEAQEIKSFAEEWSKKIYEKYHKNSGGGGTDTSSGINKAVELLKTSNHDQKIMIVITDGAPFSEQVRDSALRKAKEHNIKSIRFVIGGFETSKCNHYLYDYHIETTEEFVEKLIDVYKKLIIEK